MPQLVVLSERGADRRRPPFFKTKKLAILGNTQSIVHAPYTDSSWTLAAHCCCRPKLPREPDWYFDLHGPANFRQEKKAWTNQYYTWLRNLQTPVFMQKAWPDIPMAVRFPYERILAEYRAYFTSHAAWMIALAMTEGITHLGLFGCEYKHEQERGKQRGSTEFWLGMFEGAGGHVILPPGCSLLADPRELYGYESHDEHGKLIASYCSPETVRTAEPEPRVRNLIIIDPQSAEGRPPLMKLPDGEQPAWERSGHSIHA